MGIFNTEVFMASRFEEFKDIRSEIKKKFLSSSVKRTVGIAVVDLNDGNVSHRPPLDECLSHVRRSEFVILLLGETYGGIEKWPRKTEQGVKWMNC